MRRRNRKINLDRLRLLEDIVLFYIGKFIKSAIINLVNYVQLHHRHIQEVLL